MALRENNACMYVHASCINTTLTIDTSSSNVNATMKT